MIIVLQFGGSRAVPSFGIGVYRRRGGVAPHGESPIDRDADKGARGVRRREPGVPHDLPVDRRQGGARRRCVFRRRCRSKRSGGSLRSCWTHSHIDHTNSLPFFIDNVYGNGDCRVNIFSSPATIYAVRRHLFNNTFWPDFARLPNHLLPALRFHELLDEITVEIEGLRFTPIPTNHLVPTHGFLIEKGSAAVLWSSDTGPTKRLWGDRQRHPQSCLRYSSRRVSTTRSRA